MAKKKWDCIFSPCESLKKAMKQYKDLEGMTFEIRLRDYSSEKEIKYKIIYDAADVKKVKFRESPTFMESFVIPSLALNVILLPLWLNAAINYLIEGVEDYDVFYAFPS